jgi:peptidoglycan/LPS O-acetylase OafA/YrhL
MGAALAVFNFKIAKPYLVFFFTFFVWLMVGMICFYLLRKSGYEHLEGKSLGYDFPGYWFDEPTKYFLVNIRAFYQYTLVNLLAVSLILPAIQGSPLFPKIFLNSFVSYLGKISYGIYVFHAPIVAIFEIIGDLKGGWFKLTQNHYVETGIFVLYVTVVVGLSHLSYQYFEKKILVYKVRVS